METVGKIWHSPLNVFWHLQQEAKKTGQSAIEKDRKYQKAREARVGAVIALCLFRKTGKPTYLQLPKTDPPDVVLLQPSGEVRGQLDLTQLEITTYTGKPEETLMERLKRKKVRSGVNIYSEKYILVVNLGIGIKIDYVPLRDYLNNNKVPFPVWILQEATARPDTIARLVIVNPKLLEIEINVGEASYLFKKGKHPDVLHIRRAGNQKSVRMEKGEKYYKSPWD